jgi:hypothetical protein
MPRVRLESEGAYLCVGASPGPVWQRLGPGAPRESWPASPRLRTLPGPPPSPAASQARAMAGTPAASASAAAALAGRPAGRCTSTTGRLSGWQAGCYPRPVQISGGCKSPALPKLRQARCQPEWPVTCVSASCLGGPVTVSAAIMYLEHAAGSASSSFAGISNREVPATDSLPTAPN